MDPRESVPDHCVFSNRSAIGTTRLRSARTAELRTVAVYGLCFSFIHLFCKLRSGQPGVTAVDLFLCSANSLTVAQNDE